MLSSISFTHSFETKKCHLIALYLSGLATLKLVQVYHEGVGFNKALTLHEVFLSEFFVLGVVSLCSF